MWKEHLYNYFYYASYKVVLFFSLWYGMCDHQFNCQSYREVLSSDTTVCFQLIFYKVGIFSF